MFQKQWLLVFQKQPEQPESLISKSNNYLLKHYTNFFRWLTNLFGFPTQEISVKVQDNVESVPPTPV